MRPLVLWIENVGEGRWVGEGVEEEEVVVVVEGVVEGAVEGMGRLDSQRMERSQVSRAVS